MEAHDDGRVPVGYDEITLVADQLDCAELELVEADEVGRVPTGYDEYTSVALDEAEDQLLPLDPTVRLGEASTLEDPMLELE